MASEPNTDSRLVELSREECIELLASENFGRLVVSPRHGAPLIRPVNYVFDRASQSVVFRSARGSKSQVLARAARAAFEIDGTDRADRTGWSVIVHGVATEITSAREIGHVEALGLDPWAPGSKPQWVRIRAGTVTGRRIVPSTGDAHEAPKE